MTRKEAKARVAEFGGIGGDVGVCIIAVIATMVIAVVSVGIGVVITGLVTVAVHSVVPDLCGSWIDFDL